MTSKKFVACILFMLAGCNHLTQYHNDTPDNHISDTHPQGEATPNGNYVKNHKAILSQHCVEFADLLNNHWQVFESPTTGPSGAEAQTVTGLADIAILSLDSLYKVFAYVLNPSLDKINLPAAEDIHDIAARIGFTLTPEFNRICLALRERNNWTLEVVTQLGKAYAICAFYSAHRAYAMHRSPTITNKALNKALNAAAIAAIATQLTATFIDETCGNAMNTLINAQAVHHITQLAVSAGIQLTSAAITTTIFAAYSAADRITRAAPDPAVFNRTHIRAMIDTYRGALGNRNTLYELCTAVRSIPSYELDRPLAEIALAAHSARVAYSS
ncbi:hypothetical protein [Cardinium endosymbiont of Nabis limbatus]|uniref:hypothetical protein n=1 Tax=Cardinium endosymbiont of Nabis limbatus TaxID=3066217 RepID=UPI003AF35B86